MKPKSDKEYWDKYFIMKMHGVETVYELPTDFTPQDFFSVQHGHRVSVKIEKIKMPEDLSYEALTKSLEGKPKYYAQALEHYKDEIVEEFTRRVLIARNDEPVPEAAVIEAGNMMDVYADRYNKEMMLIPKAQEE